MVKLYEQWKQIRKTIPTKRSETQKKVAETFSETLDDLFDISTVDALETIRIEEDKEFLIMQRGKGRPGCMVGVDMVLYGREKRALERKEREEVRKRKYDEESQTNYGKFTILSVIFIIVAYNFHYLTAVVEWSDGEAELSCFESIGDETEKMDYTSEADIDEINTLSLKTAAKRGRKHFITARLTAALDNAKVSDGMAVHILIAAAEALGHRVEELVINRSSLHRLRQENRLQESQNIQEHFSDNVI